MVNMPANKLVILESKDIAKKINRLACQIAENHILNKSIQLIGLNERGYKLAELIITKIKSHGSLKCSLFQGHTEKNYAIEDLDKVNPKQPIIIVDDVLNTGRSVYHLLSLIAPAAPHQLEIAVLANRRHKQFPIHANYVGLTFATTVQEHIYFNPDKPELYLA
jgi:pyrimidine operon attenuation protein/uracil phosphoribosyltransferase